MHLTVCFLGLLLALMISGPSDAAERKTDHRPCVSYSEFVTADVSTLPEGSPRRSVERAWEVAGLGVPNPANTDETQVSYHYPSCRPGSELFVVYDRADMGWTFIARLTGPRA